MRKRTRGSFDQEAARRAAQARWSGKSAQAKPDGTQARVSSESPPGGGLEPEYGRDGDEVVERLWTEAASSSSAIGRIQALKELRRIFEADPRSENDWRDSPQVREDFVPPSPLDVVKVWYQAGALEDNDLRGLIGG